MRTLTIPLLMAALTATASKPEKMFVVIHTTDQVIVNYVCVDKTSNEADNPVLGSYVRTAGGFNWHVVGGVAPYTIVKNEMKSMNSGCITVMDAEGTLATSCGIVGVRQERQEINCQRKDDKLDFGPYGLVPNDSTDKARIGWKYKPDTKTPEALGPNDSYVPPVRGPLPTVDPPVDPKPPITNKPERRTPSTSKGPSNPPPVNRKAVLPEAKSQVEGSGHGPKSLGNNPSRASGGHSLQPNTMKVP